MENSAGFLKNVLFFKYLCYNRGMLNESERRKTMKIVVKDTTTNNGAVFVRGVYGPNTISYLLGQINKQIQETNKSLRALYEQN